MPGVQLDVEYPLASDPLATAIPALIEAVQTIQADVEDPITSTEISVVSALDMEGQALLSAGSLHCESAALAPSTFQAGTILYRDGEWFVVTVDGPIQITSGGNLNAAGIGGIQGDYGPGNPAAVTYVDSSAVYRFTDETNDWSDLECDSVILHGDAGGGTVTLRAESGGSNRALNFGTFPVTSSSLLVVDTGGVVATAGACDDPFTFVDDLEVGGDLLCSGELHHGTRSIVVPPEAPGTTVGWSGPVISGGKFFVTGPSNTGTKFYYSVPLGAGDRPSSCVVTVRGHVAETVDIVVTMYVVNATGDATSIATTTASDVDSTWQTVTATDGTPAVLAAGDGVIVEVSANEVNQVALGPCRVNFDHPV